MLLLENLTKNFNSKIAVDRLSFEVKEGEVFGFLGPNGAGKTTTVRLLTSLIGPTSGTAYVNNYEIQKADQNIRRSVGILTESPGLYDNLSAEYNLEIFANLYEVKNPKGQVEKYLRLLGLWERRFDLAGTFSKGMKQKLAIARALLHEPRVLFLDEPTAALDPESARTVRDFITELRKKGRTIFICTHNLDEADRLCDRIGVVKTRLLVLDTPEKLRQSLFGRQVVFHLGEIQDQIPKKIRKLDFVQDVKIIDNKLLVSMDDPESRNPQIIRILVQEGVDIQFVGELRHSLEEVYLKLVQDG
jgi:ABC-2 type transport system ATP-binding protein